MALTSRQIAEKKAAEWEALARALDAKIARLLPCDPHVRMDIEEVSRASEARLAALSSAVKTEASRAKADADEARAAVAGEEARLRESDSEGTDSQQERAAVEGELADLTESAKHRTAFEDARKKLDAIDAMVAQRAADGVEAGKIDAALNAALRELLVASQAREAAMAKEQAALAFEMVRWSEYYAMRLARAQTECTVTNSTAAKKKK